MKIFRFLSIPAVSVLLLIGCKKSAEADEVAASLTGKWEIRQSYSGMSPLTTYPAGNGMMVSFDGSNYKYYREGQVVHQGVYRLANDSTVDVNSCALVPPKNSAPNVILYDNTPNGVEHSFEITGNTLKLTAGCIPADGGWTIYKKVDDQPK